MALTNVSKSTSAIVDVTKTDIAETWDSIPTTWASETRTWDDMTSLIDNTARYVDPIYFVSSAGDTYLVGPSQDLALADITYFGTGIINTSKT